MVTAAAADHVFHRAEGRPVAVRAHGSTIVTADGREILDGAAGAIACSIGHGHPEVIAAMAAQAEQVQLRARPLVRDRGARTASPPTSPSVAPVDDARVFPVSGGSEANESAIKLARAYHLARGDGDRHVILARAGSYHGNSRGALDASHRAALTGGVRAVAGPDRAGAAREPVPRRPHRRASTPPRSTGSSARPGRRGWPRSSPSRSAGRRSARSCRPTTTGRPSPRCCARTACC